MKQNIRTFGFSYGYGNGAMRVKSIYAGSEAEKSGIKIGDHIFFINGHDVENLSDTQVKKFRYEELVFPKEEDESITVEILSRGERKKIKWLEENSLIYPLSVILRFFQNCLSCVPLDQSLQYV